MDLHVHPEDDHGLWDELHHQQSREIALHQARTSLMSGGRAPSSHNNALSSKSLPFVPPRLSQVSGILHRTLQQTREETTRLASIFHHAIVSSWNEHQQRHAYRLTSTTDTGTSGHAPQRHQYLDDFGIPNEHDDPNLRENVGSTTTSPADFVLLPRFRRPTPSWEAAANLDVYFTSLYSYYYHRGLLPIFLKGVVELIGLFFTLTLSIFLFVFVNWSALSNCIDESTCLPHFSGYIVSNPWTHQHRSSIWNVLVLLYAILFGAYGCFAVWTFVHSLREASMAQWVFEERLGISRRKLQQGAIDWDRDVVQKLLQLQQSGEYRIAIHGHDLDALVVAQRILRKENFLIALINGDILDLSLPGWNGPIFMCSSIEWVLHFAVLNFMFNHKYQVRPAFYLDPSSLQRRFVVCGIAHAIFMPFLLFFLLLHFGFQNAYDWKSSKRYLGPREWSLHSRWLFREFNELPHHFEKRLAPSYQAAENYLKLFGQSEIFTALGRIIVLMSGSLGAFLLILATMNDAILLHVKIADWNLLWYAGMVGVVFSIGKAMLPSESDVPRNVRNLYAETEGALQTIAHHTHYYPEKWKGRASDATTYKSISSMFQYKAKLFAMEVVSVIVAPIVLCVSLGRCADSICEFIFAIKEEIAGAGDVCGFATFDFDKYSDEAWEGRTMTGRNSASEATNINVRASTLAESILRTGSVEQAASHLPKPKSQHGKMEKSFFSFKASHPGWKCSASGQHLVDRVEQYEREETAALALERQWHIEAAARQLETLARLEQQHQTMGEAPRTVVPSVLDESYIPKTQAPADAGAGAGAGAGAALNQPYAPPPLPHALSNTSHGHADQMLLRRSPAPEFQPMEEPLLPFATNSSGSSLHGSPSRTSTSMLLRSRPSPPLGAGATVTSATGLSTELRRILNLSTLDADVSVLGQSVAAFGSATGTLPLSNTNADDDDDRRAERQYLWLERYHAHVAAQQQLHRHDQQLQLQQQQEQSQQPFHHHNQFREPQVLAERNDDHVRHPASRQQRPFVPPPASFRLSSPTDGDPEPFAGSIV